MDHAVLRDTILHRNAREAVDLNRDEAAPACYVDRQALVLQQGWEINVEAALGDILVVEFRARLGRLVRVVESIRVERLIGHDVVFQQRREVLLAVFREQEGVDLGAELFEGPVGRREEGAARVGGVFDDFEEIGLLKSEEEGRELAGKERDDLGGGWWGEEDGVDAVDHTIGSELLDGQRNLKT